MILRTLDWSLFRDGLAVTEKSLGLLLAEGKRQHKPAARGVTSKAIQQGTE